MVQVIQQGMGQQFPKEPIRVDVVAVVVERGDPRDAQPRHEVGEHPVSLALEVGLQAERLVGHVGEATRTL